LTESRRGARITHGKSIALGPDLGKFDWRVTALYSTALPCIALVVPDPSSGIPDDDLRPEEIAARQSLWRIARGEDVPSETLVMLRTLRLGAIKRLLSEPESERPGNGETS
jgi:hypothetical protein